MIEEGSTMYDALGEVANNVVAIRHAPAVLLGEIIGQGTARQS
jgi:hypothetical protein